MMSISVCNISSSLESNDLDNPVAYKETTKVENKGKLLNIWGEKYLTIPSSIEQVGVLRVTMADGVLKLDFKWVTLTVTNKQSNR